MLSERIELFHIAIDSEVSILMQTVESSIPSSFVDAKVNANFDTLRPALTDWFQHSIHHQTWKCCQGIWSCAPPHQYQQAPECSNLLPAFVHTCQCPRVSFCRCQQFNPNKENSHQQSHCSIEFLIVVSLFYATPSEINAMSSGCTSSAHWWFWTIPKCLAILYWMLWPALCKKRLQLAHYNV